MSPDPAGLFSEGGEVIKFHIEPPCDTFWDSSRGVLQRIIGYKCPRVTGDMGISGSLLVIWRNLPRIVKLPILEPKIPISPVTLGYLNL